MDLVLVVGIVWTALAFAVAVLVGRSIRLADERSAAERPERMPAFAPEAAIPLNAAG